MGYIGAGISRFNTADELTVTGDATIDTTTLVVDSTNNNVGIGTASPEDFGGGYTTLEVAGSTTANGGVFKTATSDSAGTGTAGTEMLMYSNNGGGVITVTSSDPLLFQTAGAERMRITSDGNVGIGTSAPAHNVEIVATAAGSVNDSLQIRNNATSSGTGSRIRFINSTDNTSDANGAAIASVRNGDDNDLVFETENATRMTIDHAGKVGISNTAPDFNLSVGNSSSVNPSIQIMSATNSNAQLLFGDGAGAAGYRGTIVYGNATDSMSFSTAGAERMRIDSSGNLLVGKTSSGIANNGIELRANDDVLITKDGATALYLNRKSSDGEIIEFRKDGTGVGVIGTVGGDMVAGTGDTGLRFHDGADQVYPSNTNGSGRDAAIDLGNSGARFKDGYFTGTVFAEAFTGRDDTDTAIQMTGSNTMKFFSGGAEKARITSSSTPTILVGCTVNPSASAPGSMVSTTGAGSFTSFAAANTASTHAVFGNLNGAVGTIQTTNSTTAYNTSSDRRLKSNIQDAESASDKIDAIQVRQFDWNADDSHQDYGLIAQELQPIEPMAVTGDADSDEMMGVDYSKLVPMLIKEIQELRSRVAALEE